MNVKPLKYEQLPGFSPEQISQHHDILYAGYVKKVNEIRDLWQNVDLADANATYSRVRELKIEEGFALDGVKLHELYFENLGGDGKMTQSIEEQIKRDFGSVENWRNEFVACGMSARGWVVMALDEEEKLRHFICDAHNQGGIWDTAPLLVLDVYEHAYFIDYDTNRKAYIEAFLNNVDWGVVENRI